MDALIIIFITALAALFGSVAKKPALVIGTTNVGILGAIVSSIVYLKTDYIIVSFGDYKGLDFDKYSVLISVSLLILTLIVSLLSYERFKEKPNHTGEYLGLMLFSLCGAMMMTAFTDFFMFFLALEILSIPVYVLVGIKKQNTLSSEASIKYFFTGSFATGILLFGIALIYGATGSFDLNTISTITEATPMFHIGVLFVLAAFLFILSSC
jgi:NADH-quinone oxidoreductase subunit N